MKVLVTYGSKRGGTAGIARMVSAALVGRGLDSEVKLPEEVGSIDSYDAVIIGGALYANRWPRSASKFVRQHRDELLRRPVWMFSSGPLDDSALDGSIPPTKQVLELIHKVAAQGHVTFGGRLKPDAKGFLASRMAKKHAGDHRDKEQIRTWAEHVADAIERKGMPDEERRYAYEERREEERPRLVELEPPPPAS